MQSVVATGDDWGSSAQRFPNYVDGEATWPAELLADTPDRCTTYESFQTIVAENPDRPYLEPWREENQPVGLYSKNRMEWTLSDHALSSYTLPSVAIYDTLGPDSVHYVIEHSEMIAVFFKKTRLESVLTAIGKGLPDLNYAIYFDVVTSDDKARFTKAGVELLNLNKLADMGVDNVFPHDPPTASDVAVLV
ncbi:hypothetical protein SARC_01717 [Sphaeroforma arctica JP610]|uniref:AMP-dependent synthetase/ligase domain-containing protein n=1 Tax=Sphaeroforma arctica JP610 TaxID=667725 RepID=A0A0L0GD38_9EUKA|nr:hypothetical protein SARC_01717 [Sphaeroforma arctica JP610]KNC86148.1 hypothetical protein SARC_01717 [Sphaeroforma arctica JP610]|eukprot:XP_014160050.1 hypothetical protein SARC_01717 [Sphaeroforma arctica JP610]